MGDLIKHKKNAPRRARYKNDNTLTLLWDYYYSPKNVLLKPKEDEIRRRCEKAWDRLVSANTTMQTVNYLVKKYEIKSAATAFKYISMAKQLFGEPGESDRLVKKAISEEIAIRGMKKALKNDDLRALATLLNRYNAINDLEGGNDNAIATLLKGMRAFQISFTSDEEVLDKQIAEMRKDIPAVDIGYEEVKDD